MVRHFTLTASATPTTIVTAQCAGQTLLGIRLQLRWAVKPTCWPPIWRRRAYHAHCVALGCQGLGNLPQGKPSPRMVGRLPWWSITHPNVPCASTLKEMQSRSSTAPIASETCSCSSGGGDQFRGKNSTPYSWEAEGAATLACDCSIKKICCASLKSARRR